MVYEVPKITDLAKIVTDPQVLIGLTKQGIDKDYVEFWHDYASRSKGKEYSPYAKFYRDLKSGKRIMVTSGLPKVDTIGRKIEIGWLFSRGKYYSKANLFSALVKNTQVKVTALSDQPSGSKKGNQAIWQSQLFLNSVEQLPVNTKGTLLKTDPINENYHNNVLEWDYSICKKRLRIIEGRIRERWFFDANPQGDILIKLNWSGVLKPRRGWAKDNLITSLKISIADNGDEFISASEFSRDDIKYPVRIAGSPETFYPDAHVENATVDGHVADNDNNLTWANIILELGSEHADEDDTIGSFVLKSSAEANKWIDLYRSIYLFDTSALPDGCTITATVLSLYGGFQDDAQGRDPDSNIYSAAPASNTDLVNGDFDSLGTTPYATAVAFGDWNIGSDYNDFVFNATGRATIVKDGISKYGLRSVYDATGNVPTWGAGLDVTHVSGYCAEKGTGFKPRLVVTYILPAPRMMHHYKMMRS